MTRDEAKRHATEFLGVFAHTMPPQGVEEIIRELDGWTNDIILELDQASRVDRERGHCQDDDCYELAAVSSTDTSLRYCSEHYWERRNALAWKLFKSQPRDYHE